MTARSSPPRRPARPPAPRLGPDAIAKAALALIDRDGLDRLSARRLAAALNCEAMSLYHHVAGMEGVLDLTADRLLSLIPPPPEAPADPRAALLALARAYLALADRHPAAFALIAARRWRTPRAAALAGALTRLLGGLGLKPREALRELRILAAYLNGAGLALAAWRTDAAPSQTAAADPALARLGAALGPAAIARDLAAGLEAMVAAVGR